MIFEKFESKTCCGKNIISYNIERVIDFKLLNALKEAGFSENQKFTNAGILYMENSEFIINGSFGLNKLTIKLKSLATNTNNIDILLKNL